MACPPGYVPQRKTNRCVPASPTATPFTGIPGKRVAGVPSGGMFPFSNSAPAPAPATTPAPGPTPTPSPPDPKCHDTLTTVPFSVPFTSTVNVSGGGAALQTAVTAAGPGTRLVITDSMDYTQVTVTGKTNLTIEAAAGQTPSITAAAGTVQSAIRLGAGNSGFAVRGLLLRGNGNQNGLSQPDNGILLGTFTVTGMLTADRIIVEDCTFNDLNPAVGVPGVQLVGSDGTVHDNVWVHRCIFIDCATPAAATSFGYGACTVAGFDNVYVQNCWVQRSAVARATSNMRGIVLKNLNSIVEDVLCDDIGSGGSNEAFKHNNEAIFGSAVGVSSWRNCIAYNCKRFYRITLAGATMSVFESVGDNDVVGIAAAQVLVQQSAGTLEFFDNVLVGAGDGTAFTAAVAVEHHNDVFNFLATGKVLDATDLTIDPLFEDVSTNLWNATAPAVMTGASDGGTMGIRYVAGGEEIIWCGI